MVDCKSKGNPRRKLFLFKEPGYLGAAESRKNATTGVKSLGCT